MTLLNLTSVPFGNIVQYSAIQYNNSLLSANTIHKDIKIFRVRNR